VRILVFGGAGQIGRAITEACQKHDQKALGPSHAKADICDKKAVAHALQHYAPQAIVNAAAYTAVDQAERDKEQAFRINRDGARIVAEAAAAAGLPLLHISTDYVFDGSASLPYTETDPVGPLGTYGKSKEEGERAVRAAAPLHVILRTGWVFSPFRTNFVLTILRLGSQRSELSIVDDQIGCPTSAADVAEAITTIVTAAKSPGFEAWGTYHCVGADALTWYDFAKAVFASAIQFRDAPPTLRAVSTIDFPRPAPRPAYSVLSTAKLEQIFGIRPRSLSKTLPECLMRIHRGEL
jgi:dTDP-4-dehydrorhamnose reductase